MGTKAKYHVRLDTFTITTNQTLSEKGETITYPLKLISQPDIGPGDDFVEVSKGFKRDSKNIWAGKETGFALESVEMNSWSVRLQYRHLDTEKTGEILFPEIAWCWLKFEIEIDRGADASPDYYRIDIELDELDPGNNRWLRIFERRNDTERTIIFKDETTIIEE